MQSYRLSTNLKLALVISAVLIAVASLAYTSRIVKQLRSRENTVIQLWAEALGEITRTQTETTNPYLLEFRELSRFLAMLEQGSIPELANEIPAPDRLIRYREAILWAQGMPPAGETSFIANALLLRDDFNIPSILADSARPVSWRHLAVANEWTSPEDSMRIFQQLVSLQQEMDAVNEPIPIEVSSESLGELRQWIHFGESQLIRELRIFPYVQMLFVGLFILVGYLGFSYVRRNEQSSLWVGMAKEAAHQLGTPISSLMGWSALLKEADVSPDQHRDAVEEIDKDISRLRRVANRFSNIGSRPKLVPTQLEPLVTGMVDYMRRRIPQYGKRVELVAEIDDGIMAPLNTELFEWVIENLLKNALDAIEANEGAIRMHVYRQANQVHIDVIDTGKGIDRRQWRNIFRPGYSTKKRGWGLGLSLAKRIVEDYHGGTLQLIQSRVNEGSTFRIVLPLA